MTNQGKGESLSSFINDASRRKGGQPPSHFCPKGGTVKGVKKREGKKKGGEERKKTDSLFII